MKTSVAPAIAVFLLGCSVTPADEPASFNSTIRPILSQYCFACHGPDNNKRKGGLRLDQAQSATEELDSGYTAVVPGNIEDSELFHRLTTDDDDDRMPPEDTGKSLTDAQIETIRQWIEAGAQ